MDWVTISLGIAFVGWVAWIWISQKQTSTQELGRISINGPAGVGSGFSKQFNAFVASFVDESRLNKQGKLSAKAQKQRQQLLDAGLESSTAQGRFILLRTLSWVTGPALGAITYLYFIPYYATVTTIITSIAGLLIPELWLRVKTVERREKISRELPLVLDMVNLGASAGWDLGSALDRVVDALYKEMPQHALIKELRRARLIALSGYTWEEALNRASDKLGDEKFTRTSLAISQALKQGGDCRKQLEALAGDTQRSYYSELDKRLAALPTKALLATMLLLIAYFMVLMTPAAVQIKSVVFG